MLHYLLLKLASLLVPRLPVAWAYGLAWLAAKIAYRGARAPRAAVAANLRRVLGADAASRRLDHAVRGVFHTAAYNYVDMVLIPRIRPAELAQRVEILSVQTFLDAYAQGKGVVLTTAHFGNVDLLVQMSVVHHIPVTMLVERLAPEGLFRLVAGLRGCHGVRLVPTGPKAARQLVRALRRGEVVAIAGDRAVQRQGRAVPFFGEEALLPTGAVELALHTGAPLVPAFGLRLPGRRYRITVEPPLELEGDATDGAAVARNLGRLAARFERHLRAHPEQWVVFEPLWDQRPQAPRPTVPETRPAGARR